MPIDDPDYGIVMDYKQDFMQHYGDALAAAETGALKSVLVEYGTCDVIARWAIQYRKDPSLQYQLFKLRDAIEEVFMAGVRKSSWQSRREQQPPQSGAFTGAHRRVSRYGDRF